MFYEAKSPFTTFFTIELSSCEINNLNLKNVFLFIRKNYDEWLNLGDIKNFNKIIVIYFSILSSFLIYRAVRYHQIGRKKHYVMFEKITNENRDESILNFIKYLINFMFQKFGNELTSLSIFMLIIKRNDWVAVGYAILLIFFITRKENSEKVWKLSSPIIQVSIVIQLFMLSIFICIKSCKQEFSSIKYLKIFYSNSLNLFKDPTLLIYDFVVFMMVTTLLREHVGIFRGSSWIKVNQKLEKEVKNYLHVFKTYVFKYNFWTCLVYMFMISTIHMNIFTFGYVGFVFKFLWMGNDFYISKPLKEIVFDWDKLKYYNVTVLTIKIVCKVFGHEFHEIMESSKVMSNFVQNHCSYLQDDFFIFISILIQRRIFKCKFFLNVIFDTFITTNLLASRGAEMFEDFRKKNMRRRIVAEQINLERFRRKMEKIKESANFKNIDSREPQTHESAVRRGSRYMFESEDDREENSLIDDTDETKSLLERNDVVYEIQRRVFDSNTALEIFKEKIVEKSKFLKRNTYKFLLTLMKLMNKKSKTAGFIFRMLKQEKQRLEVECAKLIADM